MWHREKPARSAWRSGPILRLGLCLLWAGGPAAAIAAAESEAAAAPDLPAAADSAEAAASAVADSADVSPEARPFEEPWDIRSRRMNVNRDANGEHVVSYLDDVVITQDELRGTCDVARYLKGSERVLLIGHVVLTSDSTVVRGPVVHYDRVERTALFPRGLVIERPSGTAIADRGTWWRDSGQFELRGHAAAADTGGTLDANAMTYDEQQESFWAVGNARMVDEASGVLVEGQNLRYERARGRAEATGDPAATFEEQDGVPVRVTSDLMTYDPTDRVAVATGDVHIRRETMEGTADLATFYRAVNRAVLTGAPEVSEGLTVISGDRIVLDLPEPGRRVVTVTGAASVSNRFASSRERPDAPAEPISAVPEGVREGIEAAGERILDGPVAPEDEESMPLSRPRPELDPGEAGGAASAPRTKVERSLRRATEETEETEEDADDEADGNETPGTGEAGEEAAEETDPTPPWLTIPSDRLPAENLLFGDEITITFIDDRIQDVRVVGHGRSKFFPNEEKGEVTEWNDVTGDTLFVWFTESAVDSVTVLGDGRGEYRLPAGEDAGQPGEILREKGKLVEYAAPRIRYRRTQETMHLDRGAEVLYKTMVLKSGNIDFEAAREIMTASGDPSPVLDDAGEMIFGQRMQYHLPTQKGEIEKGRTQFENAYYHGSDIWKMGDDVLAVQDAQYTTCENEKPHYHFASGKMKIYLDDKVVAKPVVLKIREIPVFALPFYMASLRKGRQSGFLLPNLELGVDDNRGRFIRNLGYYWAPNDYLDATATFDFYPAQDRIVSYLNGRYNVRYQYDGRATVKYNRDVPNNRKDTAVELEHRHTLSETMSLNASGRFVSTASIYQDIDDDQRLDRDIRSHLTFSKKFPGSNRSFRAELERRENLDTGNVNETFPILAFTQPNRPITGRERGPAAAGADGEEEKPGFLDEVYYRLNSEFARIRSESPTAGEELHTGAQSDVSLSTGRTLIPFVQIRPSASGEATWIDEGRNGERNLTRATYNAGVSADTKVYGTLLGGVGPVRGFRHVLSPRLSWNWAPDFREYFYRDDNGNRQDRFESFGGIGGTQRKTNRMSIGVQNLIQTKVARGEEEKRYDLFNLSQSISYDFQARDQNRVSLSNLTSSLKILSSQPVNQTWSVSHDVYDWTIQNSSVTTRISLDSGMFARFRRAGDSAAGAETADPDAAARGRDPLEDVDSTDRIDDLDLGARQAGGNAGPGRWRMDISHTARHRGGASLVFNGSWSPTVKWSTSYMAEYDLESGENTRQSWSVNRVVHCWQISFDRRLLGSEWQYYLRINVTDLPDIQAERGDRFRGRTTSGLPGAGLF